MCSSVIRSGAVYKIDFLNILVDAPFSDIKPKILGVIYAKICIVEHRLRMYSDTRDLNCLVIAL